MYVALGFQELPQPEADYENVGMQKIISTVGDVESDSTWTKKILEWLSNGIFGKMIQLKREVPSTGASPINLNGNMDNHLVAASKISNLPINRICGQVARDFMKTKTDMGDGMNNQEAEEF